MLLFVWQETNPTNNLQHSKQTKKASSQDIDRAMREVGCFFVLGLFLSFPRVTRSTLLCGDGITVIPNLLDSDTTHYPYHYWVSDSLWMGNQGANECRNVIQGQTHMTLRNEWEYQNLLELLAGKNNCNNIYLSMCWQYVHPTDRLIDVGSNKTAVP